MVQTNSAEKSTLSRDKACLHTDLSFYSNSILFDIVLKYTFKNKTRLLFIFIIIVVTVSYTLSQCVVPASPEGSALFRFQMTYYTRAVRCSRTYFVNSRFSGLKKSFFLMDEEYYGNAGEWEAQDGNMVAH